jgi:prefoldin subunit 5
MPGKIVHTNEILVLLGDQYYAERSAKEALGILQRRREGTTKKE